MTFKPLLTKLLICTSASLLVISCSTTVTHDASSNAAKDHDAETAKEQEYILVTGARLKRAEGVVAAEQLPKARSVLKEPSGEKSQLIAREVPVLSQNKYQVFKNYGVNPTISTSSQPESTFALDIDDGSYKLAKTMLERGQLPNRQGIRVEEFVNAFDYQYQSSNELFAFNAEVMPSPFRKGYHLLHVGVQVKRINESQRNPANLVLVADVSGSMATDNQLELLKQAMVTLVSQLNHQDKVALVTYSDSAKIVLPPTSANNKRQIVELIESLRTEGSTNAEAGLLTAYQVAQQMYQSGFNNRVILTLDGMANVGAVTPKDILNTIQSYRDQGIFLTTVGVGTAMYNDWLLEQLANKGNGHYLYLGNKSDIQRAFVDKFILQLQTMAKDSKIQLAFNPQAVSDYRLLGYENRHLNKADFADATKDGGELSAGHRATAIYEVKLIPNNQQSMAEIRIAYKKPEGYQVNYIRKSIPSSVLRTSVDQASSDMKLSSAVAAFAEKLRHSYWARFYDYSAIKSLLRELPQAYQSQQQVQQLVRLVLAAESIDRSVDEFEPKFPLSSVNLDRVPLLQ